MNYIHSLATTTIISKHFHHPKQSLSSILLLIYYPEFYKIFSHFYLGNVCSLSFACSRSLSRSLSLSLFSPRPHLSLPLSFSLHPPSVCVCVRVHTRLLQMLLTALIHTLERNHKYLSPSVKTKLPFFSV